MDGSEVDCLTIRAMTDTCCKELATGFLFVRKWEQNFSYFQLLEWLGRKERRNHQLKLLTQLPHLVLLDQEN
jgi:hypothetical protein